MVRRPHAPAGRHVSEPALSVVHVRDVHGSWFYDQWFYDQWFYDQLFRYHHYPY